jgi:FAD/FMN-containing dehydrogenase
MPLASSSCGTAVATAESHNRWSLMSMNGSAMASLLSRPRNLEQSTNRSASRTWPDLVRSAVTKPRSSCSTSVIYCHDTGVPVRVQGSLTSPPGGQATMEVDDFGPDPSLMGTSLDTATDAETPQRRDV